MCLKFFANRLLVNIYDSSIIKLFQAIIKQKGKNMNEHELQTIDEMTVVRKGIYNI